MDEESISRMHRFKERKRVIARYMAILLGHEFLWESSVISEVNAIEDFFNEILHILREENSLVSEYLDSFEASKLLIINEQFQNLMAIHVINLGEEEDALQDMLKLVIEILDLVVKSNNRNQRIPPQDFINETFSNGLNMKYIAKQYYTRKKKQQSSFGSEGFIYLNYPWLFSTAAKVEVIQYESRFNIEGQLDMIMNEFDMGFIGIDGLMTFTITVRRNHLLEDTLRNLSTQSKNYKKQLKIKFQGEEGVDQGGVKKEFFHLIMKELFNPNYAMFESKFNGRFLWFNKLSFECNVNFELIGTILALAIYNSVLLPAPFPKVVYKKLLNEPLKLSVGRVLTKGF